MQGFRIQDAGMQDAEMQDAGCRVFIILLLAAFTACEKTNQLDELPESQYPPIFSSQQEAGDAVSLYLLQHVPGEQLIQIENIVFLESGNKSYALVYYQTNIGHSNILYQRDYVNGIATMGKTYHCSGSNCACLVQTTINQSGQVSFDCSCSSCSLITDNF